MAAMRYLFFYILPVLLLTACGGTAEMPAAVSPIPIESVATIDPSDSRLAEAQRIYNMNCAHCHGYGGEGQPVETARRTESLGYHTVPLHNAAGHSWQHPDQVLFETIRYGVQVPTNLYTMTAFQSLSDEEIYALIDYISLWWTDEQRAWQEGLTRQFTENNPFWSESLDEEQP
jgi:mono/diheme cytochrome c family protein